GGWRFPPEVLEPDVPRGCRRRPPGAPHRARPPLVPVAGRGDLGLPAQGERVDRPLRLVAEVLRAPTRPVRELAAADEGPLRVRLPSDHPGPVARRLRRSAVQGRGPAVDPEGERGPAARAAGRCSVTADMAATHSDAGSG